MADEVVVTQEIDAAPDKVWAMVADLSRMGEWSPENEGAVWRGGATGAAPGARFRGRNSNGAKKWGTSGRIVDCQPGTVVSWRVTVGGLPIADWRYDVEPAGSGCRVTETWTDRRGWLAKTLGGPVSGVTDRLSHNRAGMEETLRRLKGAAEAAG